MSNRINISEVSLDKRMFQMNVKGVEDAPWLNNIDTMKYSSLKTEQIPENISENIGEIPKKLSEGDLFNHDVSFLENGNFLLDKKITEKQKKIIMEIPPSNPELRYMKISKIESFSVTIGMSEHLEASFFVFDGNAPITEVIQVNFYEKEKVFHLFGRKTEKLIVPYTNNEKTLFLCIFKMVVNDDNSSPFAIGYSHFNESLSEMEFVSIQFQPNKSLIDQINEHKTVLNIKLKMNVEYGVQPEDGITARITPYDPMMPSPFLTIYGLRVISQLNKSYKVKVFLKDDDDNIKVCYAKPTSSKLSQHFKSHTVVSKAQLLFPEPITFLLDPSYNKVFSFVVTVNEVGLLKSKEKVVYRFRIDSARKKVSKEFDGTLIELEYFYPSLIAPNEELRLPLEHEGIPPMFESTVFDDLWPHILTKNLLSNNIGLNFLSVILARISKEKLSSFCDRYFYCDKEFAEMFLRKMKESFAATERIAPQLFPILFKGICMENKISDGLIKYIEDVSTTSGIPQTKEGMTAMLLRMRRFFETKTVENLFYSFIRKLSVEDALRAYSVAFSDECFVSDLCSNAESVNFSQPYSRFTSYFFSIMYKYCRDANYIKLICTDLVYLTNTLERFSINGFLTFLPIVKTCLMYFKLFSKEMDISSVILSIFNTTNPEEIHNFLLQISEQSRERFISQLKSFCTNTVKTLRVFKVFANIKTFTANMLDLTINSIFKLVKELPAVKYTALTVLCFLIEKHHETFFQSRKIVINTIEECVSMIKNKVEGARCVLEFIFGKECVFVDDDTKKYSEIGFIIATLNNYETLNDITKFLDEMKTLHHLSSIQGKTNCHIEEAIKLRSICLAYKGVPEIEERIIKKIVKVSEDNKDYNSAFIAQCKLENTPENQEKAIKLAQKEELHSIALDLPINEATPSIFKLLSNSALAISEKRFKKPSYWRVFISGPVATSLGGGEFIYMGDKDKFIETIQNSYENVKINAKPIPMFGKFSTTTIQVLPVTKKDNKTFEYYFMMPEDQWDDVLAIKYTFVTEEDVPGPVCLIASKSVNKEQISKVEIYKSKLSRLVNELEDDNNHVNCYLPSKKFIDEWVEDPIIPYNNLNNNIKKVVEQSTTDDIIKFVQTVVKQKKADEGTPEVISETIRKLVKAVENAAATLRKIDELRNKSEYSRLVDEVDLFIGL